MSHNLLPIDIKNTVDHDLLWPNEIYSELTDYVIHNNLEQARLFIPHCDCKHDNSYLLQLASCHGHQEMFDLLYPLSDPRAALDALIADNSEAIACGIDPDVCAAGETLLRERLAVEDTHQNLTQAVGDVQKDLDVRTTHAVRKI